MAPIEPGDILLQLINRQDQKLDELRELVSCLRSDVAGLKAMARFWGVCAGSISGIVAAIAAALVSKAG